MSVMTEFLQEYISSRISEDFQRATFWREDVPTLFTLSYYDTYALLGMTKRNIKYLNEEVLQEVKVHKHKLYFTISYSPLTDSFELNAIIYGVSLQKCIRVVTSVKRILAKYSVGSRIENFTRNNKTFTSVILQKALL